MYQVIEAADQGLTCDTTRDPSSAAQWWPLGLVRSKTWAASPNWEQMSTTPFVGGPAGNEPHVGCSVQYNSLWADPATAKTYFSFWDVSFYPANKSTPFSAWHIYELEWGALALPMKWPGPPQAPPAPTPPSPPPPDCGTKASCKASCPGFVECAADGRYYCCAAQPLCSQQHACKDSPGLLECACPPTSASTPHHRPGTLGGGWGGAAPDGGRWVIW
jgi:hypothetical protein